VHRRADLYNVTSVIEGSIRVDTETRVERVSPTLWTIMVAVLIAVAAGMMLFLGFQIAFERGPVATPSISDPVDQRPGQRPASDTLDLASARSLGFVSPQDRSWRVS
jgi:hypothetical protein